MLHHPITKRKILDLALVLLIGLLIGYPLDAQDAPPGVIDTAIQAANTALPQLGQPDSWNWEQLPQVTVSSLGCPLVTGDLLPAPVTPYRVTLTYNVGSYGAGAYVIYLTADLSLVQLCDSKFPDLGAGAISTTTPSETHTIADFPAGTCLLTPAGAYSNVRSRPDLESDQVTIIYENDYHPVTGRSADSLWYLTDVGWVNHTVSELTGSCANLPVSDAVVYPGGMELAPNPYPCPADFAGYLPPRIQVTDPYATVAEGGVPNRLRAEPSTTAEILGEVPPGGSFNMIIDGPACNEGFVWWLVSYGEIGGWTVESNFATSEYYLEPGRPSPSMSNARNALMIIDDAGISAPVFNPSGAILATTAASTGDTAINLYNMIAMQAAPYAQLDMGSPTNNITFHPTEDKLVASDFGGITFWELSNAGVYEARQRWNDVSNFSTGFPLAINPAWTMLATAGCAEYGEGGCLTGEVRVWDMATGTVSRTFSQSGFYFHVLSFRADGTTLLAAGSATVAFWDATTGNYLNSISPDLYTIYDAQFSPDGILVAVAGCKAIAANSVCVTGVVEIWDVTTLTLLRAIEYPGAQIMNIDFSPDGLFLAAAAAQNVEVWEVATGQSVLTLTGHEGLVFDVAFSPSYHPEDSTYILASVDSNNVLLVWGVGLTTTTTTTTGDG